MIAKLKPWLVIIVAFSLGTLYAALLGLVSFQLNPALISWPIWIMLFCFLFWKFKLLHVAGYFAVLPISILSFEVTRTIRQPPQYAFQLTSLDRSHYTPRTRVLNRKPVQTNSDIAERPIEDLYIGEYGFRADPETEGGNPTRCHEVLIGDSMIYGLGLPYAHTLRPVLKKMNVDACVFGVAGNSPVDYLATLNYVRDRIADGAHIAIYVYAYNDFITLGKYLERTTRGLSPSFVRLAGIINYYDDWRRTTFVQGYLRKVTTTLKPPLESWRLKTAAAKDLEVHWHHDPARHYSEGPLSKAQRATFQFFLQRLRELVDKRPWQVSIVFIPDNEEMLANLAQPSSTFRDMDQRRAEALKICFRLWSNCRDLSPFLFERVVAEGQSPYITKDRHFSLYGNRILAAHYISMAKPDMAQAH